jgi:peptidoglycan/xylan/chitin deacetylase (PgdA/CDA1 family)
MNFTTKYSEIKKNNPNSLRGLLREIALTALSHKTKLLGIEKHLKTPRVQFLYIHHVFEDEESKFDVLLRQLTKHHTFISYSEAVEKVLTGNIDKPYIALSSDDGFKNNLKAAEIAEKYGASMCFFINPGIIGENDFHKIKDYCITKLSFPPVEFLTWEDVKNLKNKGHEIGSHTLMHINVAKSTKETIEQDMLASIASIKENCGSVEHFAFPYGREFHFSNIGRQICFNVGLKTCASAERGCHIASNQILLAKDLYIRRDHVVLDWDLNHILFFLANNAKNAHINNNLFPKSLLS